MPEDTPQSRNANPATNPSPTNDDPPARRASYNSAHLTHVQMSKAKHSQCVYMHVRMSVCSRVHAGTVVRIKIMIRDKEFGRGGGGMGPDGRGGKIQVR